MSDNIKMSSHKEKKLDSSSDNKTKQRTLQRLQKKTSEEDLAEYGFKIGRVLGEGSYSSVRTATYKGQEIAVKIINRDKVSKDFARKFLPREIEIMSKIKHDNVVKVYKIFNYPLKVYIFMENLRRGDLLNYIRRKRRLTEDEARFYFKQMVEALIYLHKIHIAHRDLKCENIMLSEDDKIKLIDFGFCRSSITKNGRRVLSETYCGSTAYAAPEVLQGTPYNAIMYDVWSLGCILFIMVAGSMPFDDSHVTKMVQQQLKRKLKYPASIKMSSELKAVLKCMLEPDVTKRYSIERVAKLDWVTAADSSSNNTISSESSN